MPLKKPKRKIKELKTDLSPWALRDSERNFDDNFSSLTLYHSIQLSPQKDLKVKSTHENGVSQKQCPNRKIKNMTPKYDRIMTQSSHNVQKKTLTYIKDYYQEHYHCENKQAKGNPEIVPLLNKGLEKRTSSRPASSQYLNEALITSTSLKSHKANVVDLVKTFQESLLSQKVVKRPSSAHQNRILKIKQEIRRHNQDRNPKKSTLLSTCKHFYQNSKSLPLRTSFAPSKPQKITFPTPFFNELLSKFLDKI